MDRGYVDFLVYNDVTDTEPVFFSFAKEDGSCRCFTYSGLNDFEINDANTNMIITHLSAKIILNGTGLNVLFSELRKLNVHTVIEGVKNQDDDGHLYGVNSVVYIDVEDLES